MSAHTLWWVLSRGSARWCEALGAHTTALSPAPQPGTRAGGPPAPAPPPASPKKKGKKKGKRPLGEGEGRGPGAASSPAENSTERGGESPLQFPPSPPKIIWKSLPTSSGTSDTFLHFQADKALSRESPGPPSGQREGFPRAPLPLPPSRPTRNHRSDGCHPKPTGRLGLRARGRGGHQHF